MYQYYLNVSLVSSQCFEHHLTLFLIFLMYRAEEIAGTVIYLASTAGLYTNGQEIVIDGGAIAVNPSTA